MVSKVLIFSPSTIPTLIVSLQPKPLPAASSSTPAPVPAQVPAPQPEAAPAPAPVPLPPVETVSQPAEAPPPPAFGDPSTFLSGPGLQDAINNMIEMGFPRDQVLRAMRASFNNADRAVEYLMTVRCPCRLAPLYSYFLPLKGIPSHLEAEEAHPSAAPAAQAPAVPAAAPPAAQAQPQGQPQNLFQVRLEIVAMYYIF